MKFPSIQELHKFSANEIFQSHNYFQSYPHFIQYFENKNELTLHDIVIGTAFTYSWMPTILDIYGDEERLLKCRDILNQVKKTGEINLDDFAILADTVNHSEVGASKILHFISPELYPIWDSRVKAAVEQKGRFNYLEFRLQCLNMIREAGFLELHEIILEKKFYTIPNFKHTKLRSLDLLLFAVGAEKMKDKRQSGKLTKS